MSTFIITDSTSNDVLFPAACRTGAVPRDYGIQPVGSDGLKPPSGIKLIPESEWIPRIQERERLGIGLSAIRKQKQLSSKDQNGQGYCWAYSVTRAMEYLLLKANQPFELLSAHSVACKIKGFRDDGGWCGLSAQFIAENGIVPESLWPAKSMSPANNTSENWNAAKAYRMTEGWYDVNRQVWDQDLTWQAVVSLLLQNVPVPADFMWWGHSVCLFDVTVKDGEVCPVLDNSWTSTWGDNGTAILQGSRKIPDGAVAPLVSVAA